MEFKQIKELIDLCAEKQIFELQLEDEHTMVRIKAATRSPKVSYVSAPAPAAASLAPLPIPAGEAAAYASSAAAPALGAAAALGAGGAPAPAEAEDTSKYVTVKSPMVGTFYQSPAPDAPSFVHVGDLVKPETVLCIVEAMKLMNEIKAETSGKVVKVLVENAQPVEYGQPLFYLEP